MCACAVIVFTFIYLVAGPALAGQSDLDAKKVDINHVPQSRFSIEVDIPLSKDEDNRGWTNKNKWAIIISVVLLAGSAALLSSHGDDTDIVPYTNTGGVKGSW